MEEEKDVINTFVLRYSMKERVLGLMLLFCAITFVILAVLFMAWGCIKLATVSSSKENTQEQIQLLQEQNQEMLDMLNELKEEGFSAEEAGTEN
jgi:CHASE3 domain sensor protein